MSKNEKAAWVVIVLLLLAVVAGALLWCALFREEPQELADDSIEEYFKYGSIGTEEAQGLPYWIWLVLPKMFPEYLPTPGGYAALGFPWEQGREMPVGFSKKTIGFERVGLNCALCHTATFRRPGEPTAQLVLGGAAITQDVLAYQRFLFACASDPRFTAGNILTEIGQITSLPLGQRLLYRFVLVPQTRKALLEQKAQFAWTDSRPPWGRGRIDPFNPVKVMLLDVPVGDTIGNADMEPVWNLRPRTAAGKAFHWDGLNTDLREVVLSSALGDGATVESLPMAELERIETFLLDLQAPTFSDYFAIDDGLAATGEPLYRQHCADCHAPDGSRTGTVLPLDDPIWQGPLGDSRTDPHRAAMWTPEAADAYNHVAQRYPWGFQHFRSTNGYVSVPLDGLWLRAPYLHNGSVPYLDELLEPPAARTTVFWRGYDVYDPKRMGFVADGEAAQRAGTLYLVGQPGNSNQGHLWGTDLSAADKRALLEYLKTL